MAGTKDAKQGQVSKDAKPAGAEANKPQETPKVDKRRKTDGKTCRQSLFDFVRKDPKAPKEIIKAVVEETGCAQATVRTHINKMWNEGNLMRVDHDGTGYLYQVADDAPMLQPKQPKKAKTEAEAEK